MEESLTQKARRFATLKSQAEYFEAKAKVIKDAIEKISAQLYDEMIEEGIDEIRVSARLPGKDGEDPKLLFPDGIDRIITPEEKFKCSIKSSNQELALKWFRENGHESLIKTAIDGVTLNAWMTTQKTKNLPVPPGELVSVFSVTKAKITRARSAKKKGG